MEGVYKKSTSGNWPEIDKKQAHFLITSKIHGVSPVTST